MAEPITLINEGGATLTMYPDFAPADWTSVKELPLETRPRVVVYGKECHQNRNVGFFSDSSSGYRFSGQVAKPKPMNAYLQSITDSVNAKLGTSFNGVLVNHYPDGDSNIGAHSDDERGLSVKGRFVAAISFGSERTFRVKDKKTKKTILDVKTSHRSLLVMGGTFQEKYTHEIPKKKGMLDRWSLTFREHTH